MKNGQLWFNINTNRVERVVGQLNKVRVFTVGHGYSNLKVVKKTMLVKANGSQVNDYLTENKPIAKVRELPPLPTLPRLQEV
tara:strand:- start:145 stop:390 length:246 start_codon:yes stop_codon:yes gene_type:complete